MLLKWLYHLVIHSLLTLEDFSEGVGQLLQLGLVFLEEVGDESGEVGN